MAWNAIKSGAVAAVAPVENGAPGASLFVPFTLSPGQKKTITVFTAWYVPETDMKHGKPGEAKDKDACDPESGCCSSPSQIGLDKYDHDFDAAFYKPWYSNRFKSVEEVSV